MPIVPVRLFYLFIIPSFYLISCGIHKEGYLQTNNTESSTQFHYNSLSKYPVYSISQAKILVKTQKCKIISGSLDEETMRREVDGVRAFETEKLQELYNTIDFYIEQDNANATVVLFPEFSWFPVYTFTTMLCGEVLY